MSRNMTAEAVQGFAWKDGGDAAVRRNPYLQTSDSWAAWQIGRWLDATGRLSPKDVRTSRGSTYHVSDMKVRVHVNGEVVRI